MAPALETLRKQAEKAAQSLRDAEAKSAEAHAAARERNDARRVEFWEGVRAKDLPAASQALVDAREAFTAAVVDGGDVVGAYVDYARAHAAHQRVNNATADALSWVVNDLTGERHEEAWGRTVYPDGLSKQIGRPAEFLPMLNEAAKSAAEAHGQAVAGELRERLASELEPEQ